MISMDKQYTCGGEPVRLLCVDGPAGFPVLGIRNDMVCAWTANGARGHYVANDAPLHPLVEVREKRRLSGWLNVYPRGSPGWYKTKAEADDYRDDSCLACVDLSRFEFEVGQGMEDK